MQQMGDGKTDPNFYFGSGSSFVYVFLKQKLVRKILILIDYLSRFI